MSEPSVLVYARYFELTQDHTIHDPLKALDVLPAQPKGVTISQESGESVNILVKGFEEAARDYVVLANNDPLPVSQDVANYLESYNTNRIRDITQIYDELLPDPHRIRRLKLDLPLLVLGGGDVERDAKRIRKGIDLQAVIDDFLEDDDEPNHHQKHESAGSSAVSAEILEWSKNRLEAAMKKEKLEVSLETMKYIRETFSVSVEPTTMSRILLDSMPEITHLDNLNFYSLAEDDFQSEVEIDTPDCSDVLEPYENDDEQLPLPIKREIDMLGRLDAAVDGEFLQSTQADREMDELFRQFIHHDFDDRGEPIVDVAENGDFEGLPPAKRQKLVHETDSGTISQDIIGNELQDLKMRIQNMKTRLPNILDHASLELPVIDLPIMFSRVGKSSDNKAIGPGPPPFRIPTIQEALHESMPTQTKVAEKFIVEEKAIISSDMLLWKEPGLRLLDKDDMEDDHIVADTYEIEERELDTFMNVSPDCKRGATTTGFFERSGGREGKNRTGHRPNKDEAKTALTAIKPEPVDKVYVKQEFRLDEIDASIVGTETLPVNPFTRNQACFLSGPKEVSGHIVQNRASESVSRIQKSPGSLKLSSESTDKKPMIAKYDAGLKSLLPETKRRQLAQQTGTRNESVLNDSLSSFLDLKGKQFKLPAVNRVCEAEVTDDPILSTQDSLVEEWFSDEHTLALSPIQPTQSVQEEKIPSITLLEEPRTIIVNSTLLQTKPLLIQFLESTDATNLTLIYRDIDMKQLHGPDLILKATTCLFITNLQSLNQRPLPGQNSVTGLSSAHDRVANLARSYSQVVVLVHHLASTDSATESKTVSTQASFAAFCQRLATRSHLSDRKVQPYWLPCVNPASTSNVVNAWVWQIINRCAYRNGSPKSSRPDCLTHPTLIQEETLWELFLCKAGLNPLAAQIVISSLKRSSVQNRVGAGLEVIWGLRKLVAMSSQERTKLFGDMIGPDVVERLNATLSNGEGSEHRM